MRAGVPVPVVRLEAGVDDANELARRLGQCRAMANAATTVVGAGVREIIGRMSLRREASMNRQEQRDLRRQIGLSTLSPMIIPDPPT